MNVLFVIPEYPPHSGGGIATFYRHFLPQLAMRGHRVHAIVGSALSVEFPEYEDDSVVVESLDKDALKRNLKQFDRYSATPALQRHLAAAWTAWEQAKCGQGYDIVETTDWGLLCAPWIVSSESPLSVIQLHASIGQISFHDPQSDTQLQDCFVRLLEKELLTYAEELQTYSKSNAQFWRDLTGRVVTHIDPAVEVSSKVTVSNARNFSGLVVGRVQYWKGPTVLCEALRLIDNSVPIIEWIGRDTAYKDSNSSMSAYLSSKYADVWGKTIIPKGSFPTEETKQRQAAAGFVIVPSIWDVFNYTCVEAMAQEKVVICSTGAGAHDLIINGVNGLVFEADNPVALAESIKFFLSMSETERIIMGRAARRSVENQLSPNIIVEQRIKVYEKIIQRDNCSAQPTPWLIDAVIPKASVEESLAFLNKLPLNKLGHYVVKRSLEKMFK